MTDYTKLVEALRCKRDDCEGCDLAFFDKDEGWMCQFAAKDDDAAAAIEELQAEVERLEPKRGEWIGRQNHKKCSVCGKQAIYDVALYTDMKTPYCPHCGAKMEVQE